MRANAAILLVVVLLSASLQGEPATIHPGNPSTPEENYHSTMWDALKQLPDDETADSSAADKAIADALKNGADPNDYAVYDGIYSTPLLVSVRRQNIPLLRLLLDKGADPNRPENEKLGNTIISADRPDILLIVIEKGWRFDPNLPGGCSSHGEGWPRLPLHAAVSSCSPRMVQTLLKLGADPYLTETSNPDWLKRASGGWKPKKGNAFQLCEQLTVNCPPEDLDEKRAVQMQIRKLLAPYLKKQQPLTAPAPLKP